MKFDIFGFCLGNLSVFLGTARRGESGAIFVFTACDDVGGVANDRRLLFSSACCFYDLKLAVVPYAS